MISTKSLAYNITPEISQFCESNGYVIKNNTLTDRGNYIRYPSNVSLESKNLDQLKELKKRYEKATLDYDYGYDVGFFSKYNGLVFNYKAESGKKGLALPSDPTNYGCLDIVDYLKSQKIVNYIDSIINEKIALNDLRSKINQAKLEAKNAESAADAKKKSDTELAFNGKKIKDAELKKEAKRSSESEKIQYIASYGLKQGYLHEAIDFKTPDQCIGVEVPFDRLWNDDLKLTVSILNESDINYMNEKIPNLISKLKGKIVQAKKRAKTLSEKSPIDCSELVTAKEAYDRLDYYSLEISYLYVKNYQHIAEENRKKEIEKNRLSQISIDRNKANKLVKDKLKEDQKVYLKEQNRINAIINQHSPKTSQVIISRKLDDGTMIGSIDGKLAGVRDYLGIIKNAGLYRIEVIILPDTLSRKLANGFTETIPIYATSQVGEDLFERWKNSSEGKEILKSYNETKSSINKIQAEIDVLR